MQQTFYIKIVLTDPNYTGKSGQLIPLNTDGTASGNKFSFSTDGIAQLIGDYGNSIFPLVIDVRQNNKKLGSIIIPNKGIYDKIALPGGSALDNSKLMTYTIEPTGVANFRIGTEETQVNSAIKNPIINEIITPVSSTLTSTIRPNNMEIAYRQMKGKVSDLSGKPLKNTNFIIYAQLGKTTREVSSKLAPIANATTDSLGAFSIRVPNKVYQYAIATIGNATDEPVDIILEEDGKLPEFALLILLKTQSELLATTGEEIDDCACHDKPNRLPEMEDLLNPEGKYQQDIGGACVNFTTPNRALEEFSFYKIVRTTDPQVTSDKNGTEIKRIEALITTLNSKYQAAKIVYENPTTKPADKLKAKDNMDQAMYDIMSHTTEIRRLRQEAMVRKELNIENQLDWDDTPTTYQATSIAHGHILEFRQVWRADGYSMGDLLYSLPLAPGQKKQIAIFDWDRRESALRSEDQTQEESLQNTLSRDRDVSDIVNSTLSENLSGSSSSNSNSTSKSISATVGSPPNPFVSASVTAGISNTKSSASSESSQQSARDLAASSLQQLRDKTMQSASSLRSQRSTVIQSVNQGESMNVTTESVANYNHCHAMTVQYFEVLRHFALTTELADVQECLFIPLPMGIFDNAKVMRWREILLRAVGNRSFIKGFDAVARAEQARLEGATTTAYSDMPNSRYCDDGFTSIEVEFKLRCFLARPAEIYPSSTPTLNTIAATTNGSIFTGIKITELLESARNTALIDNPADISNWQTTIGFIPDWTGIRRRVLSSAPELRDIIFQQEIEKADWISHYVSHLIVAIAGVLPIPGNLRILNRNMKNVASKSIKAGSSNYEALYESEVSVGISTGEVPSFAPRINITRMTLQRRGTGANTYAVGVLPDGSSIKVISGSGRYRTRFYSGYLFNNVTSFSDLADGEMVDIATPTNADEMRSPRQELEKARQQLLMHLNNNLEVYHNWLFYFMSADRRYMMLDGIQIKVPGRKILGSNPVAYEPDEMRSVASVVENRIISIVGNTIVMPVAKGYNLNPDFRYDDDMVTLEDGTVVSYLMNHYMPHRGFKATPFRVSVPTKGVFAEAVMGACNSCERIDDTRFWKWEEHPIPDDPTSIQPISTDTRRADVGNLQAKDFAQPIVNIQNAPDAPAPTGLGAALELMGKADAFRDATGLQGTQEALKAAMELSNEANKHAIDRTAEIVKQNSAIKSSPSLTQQIKNSGLSKEKKEELMEELLRTQITGKPTKEEPVNEETDSEEDSTDENEESGQLNGDFDPCFDITPIKQPSSMTCWATVATMMVAWKTGDKEMTIKECLKNCADAGDGLLTYQTMFNKNKGLKASTGTGSPAKGTKDHLVAQLGMTIGEDLSFSPQGFKDLLTLHGPIWLTTDEDSGTGLKDVALHARILVGINTSTNMMAFIDPATGKMVEESYDDFNTKHQQAYQNMTSRIIYFENGNSDDDNDEGEGWGANDTAVLIINQSPTTPNQFICRYIGGTIGGLSGGRAITQNTATGTNNISVATSITLAELVRATNCFFDNGSAMPTYELIDKSQSNGPAQGIKNMLASMLAPSGGTRAQLIFPNLITTANPPLANVINAQNVEFFAKQFFFDFTVLNNPAGANPYSIIAIQPFGTTKAIPQDLSGNASLGSRLGILNQYDSTSLYVSIDRLRVADLGANANVVIPATMTVPAATYSPVTPSGNNVVFSVMIFNNGNFNTANLLNVSTLDTGTGLITTSIPKGINGILSEPTLGILSNNLSQPPATIPGFGFIATQNAIAIPNTPISIRIAIQYKQATPTAGTILFLRLFDINGVNLDPSIANKIGFRFQGTTPVLIVNNASFTMTEFNPGTTPIGVPTVNSGTGNLIQLW